MAKHEVHEEHENHERWLVSYADFMTLLFALFVVLYAMSAVDSKKVRQVETAVRWALHIEGDGGGGELPLFRDFPDLGSKSARVLPPSMSSPGAKVEAIVRRIGRHTGGATHLTAELDGRRLIVRMSAADTFEPGSARLLPSAMASIDYVMGELATLGQTIRIEGHTDTMKARGIDNWELSALRAASVARYAEAAKLLPHERLAIAGYADTRPLVDNDSEQHRQRNRRIDFIVELAAEGG
ncbi:MAG TPA: flagellar motor protein MotB [Myxococcota bacterium]